MNDLTGGQQYNHTTWSAFAFPQDVKNIYNICNEGELKWFPWVQIARDAKDAALRRLFRQRMGPVMPSPVIEMVMMYCD